MSDDDLRAKLTEALRAHQIECTGIGEVTCRGCRNEGWMSWPGYRGHLADALLPVVCEALADAWDDGHASGWVGQETNRNPWRGQS